MSFKVAVLGNQEPDGNEWFMSHHYGIQVFDLSVDQICSLLQNPESDKAVDIAKLGTAPTVQYQVMGGGRFYPSISREEIAQTMQGVDIMLTVFSTQPWMIDFVAQEFFQCLISDNLLDQCKAVVVRIVPWKTDNARLRRSTKPLSADDILTRSGLNAASSIKEKFYVLADNEVAQQKTRKSKRKSKKQPKLDGDVSVAISQLRSHLLGEEMREAVVRPVKETVSAGKALLNMGQRFSSWVSSSLVKS